MKEANIEDPHNELPTLSFFTVCKGRLHHLKQTLKQNLEDNKDYPRIEFVLLDYNSPDGLKDWVLENFSQEMESGYLRFFQYPEAEFFRFSHSRNLAFRLSKGRIVCNVDADNYTGKGFAFYLAEELTTTDILTGCKIADGVLDPSQDEGAVGRMAAYRELIHLAGGYDEAMESWGYEDMDLCERLRDLGYSVGPIDPNYLSCIKHNDQERAKYVEDKEIGRDTVWTKGTCYEHIQLSLNNRSIGKLRANVEGYGLGKVIEFSNQEKKLEVEPFRYRKITYCTTSMNRLHHLKSTLPQNILDNLHYPDQEFLILDYNSTDGLEHWMETTLGEHLDSGLVRLYRTTEPRFFIKSHAMNMAFRLATGDIIVNLDADNFTGKGFSDFVNEGFDQNEASFLMIDLDRFPDRRDAVGRIAMRKEDFHEVRGYDERMDGYGWEDFDVCHRLSALGLKKRFIDDRSFLNYINHGNDERVKAGKTFTLLEKLYKLRLGGEEGYSLYFLFNNQTFTHLLPSPPQRKWGKWREEGRLLILNGGTEEPQEFLKDKGYTSARPQSQARLEEVTHIEEINGAIIRYHLFENEGLMNRSIQEGKATANAESYGKGTVYRSFSNDPIAL